MKKLYVSRYGESREVLVDDEDYKILSKYKWYSVGDGYAGTRVDGKHITMHRMITDVKEKDMIDHIDGNILNNQKSNLRVVNMYESNKNRSGRKNSSSIYKGVWWDSVSSKWAVEISSNKKRTYGGRHESEVVAARIYNDLARKLHGKFARLNNV